MLSYLHTIRALPLSATQFQTSEVRHFELGQYLSN